jgi:hypothetical protein
LIPDVQLMAENTPQSGVRLVEAFLAVNFKDIARP